MISERSERSYNLYHILEIYKWVLDNRIIGTLGNNIEPEYLVKLVRDIISTNNKTQRKIYRSLVRKYKNSIKFTMSEVNFLLTRLVNAIEINELETEDS
jgi:hypothetical protein